MHDRAQLARIQHLAQAQDRRLEPALVADAQHQTSRLTGRHTRPRALGGQGQGLFAKHMLASSHSRQNLAVMLIVGRGQDHALHTLHQRLLIRGHRGQPQSADRIMRPQRRLDHHGEVEPRVILQTAGNMLAPPAKSDKCYTWHQFFSLC
jgi:hypothetical protein